MENIKNTMKICIVGGGSAGWMTATTFCKLLNYDITLVESPDIPNCGVGESTLQFIQKWIDLVGLREYEQKLLVESNGTLKHSIKFTNFLKQNSGGFHYPFGTLKIDPDAWWSRQLQTGKYSPNDFGTDVNHIGRMAEKGKVSVRDEYAYHFDATLFGHYLKKHHCQKTNHILGNVVSCEKFEDGIKSIKLDTGETIKADLFIDCTGFASKLIGEFLNEPYVSYENLLPNNRAIATHIPYKNKRKQMVPYTECTAIENGWVWQIPLWNRLGSGYVYSSKHVSDEDAKKEFINELKRKKLDSDGEYKIIPMRVGRYERSWVGNVIAIGLSAGFLEPLEGNGLLTVHENLIDLYKTLRRGEPSAILKQYYNSAAKVNFDTFAEFLVIHYSFTQRKDTQYWRDVFNKEYNQGKALLENLYGMYGLCAYSRELYQESKFKYIEKGFPYIASGMNVSPYTLPSISLEECKDIKEFTDQWDNIIDTLPSMYDYLKAYVYN